MSIQRTLTSLIALALGVSVWASAGSSWAAPTVDMLWDAGFTAASDTVEFPPLLITNDSTTTITVGTDIRLVIPPAAAVTWATSDTTIEVLLSGTGAVSSAVSSFPVAGNSRVVILGVTTSFDATTRMVVTGLGMITSTTDMTQTFLGMNWNATNTSPGQATSNQSFSMWRGEFASANNFSFKNGDVAPTLPSITVTEAPSAPLSITNANEIVISIPNVAAFGTAPTFDNTVTTLTLTGSAATKVSSALTAASFTAGNRTVTIDVTADFAPGESVTISGLRFATITAAYTADSLELQLNTTPFKVVDKRVFAIGPPTVTVSAMPTVSASASNQALQDASAVPVAVTTTITDTNGAITAASDLRLMILGVSNTGASLTGRDNLTWVSNLALTSTFSGTGAIASPPLGVRDSGNNGNAPANEKGRLMTIDVTTSFAANTKLTMTAGLNANNSSGTATKLYIGLIIQGFTTNDRTKAFGNVVSIATDSNLAGGGGGGSPASTRRAGGGVCFLRSAQRPSTQ